MSPLDTGDWELSAHIVWRPKRTPRRAPCTYCSGNGTVGGGFKSIDGPQECPECFGTGKGDEIDQLAPQPAVPKELVKHMRDAWLEYFAAYDKRIHIMTTGESNGAKEGEEWVCPWGICNHEQAQECRAMKGITKLTRGCGTLFPPGTTPEQAKEIISRPIGRRSAGGKVEAPSLRTALLMYQHAVESGCVKDDLIACYAHAENALHSSEEVEAPSSNAGVMGLDQNQQENPNV